MYKPILCVDFDGVIHAYTSPWTNATTISDGPTPGALRWLWKATEWFDVQVYSSRSKDPEAVKCMRYWMAMHSTDEFGQDHPMAAGHADPYPVIFAHEKPAAFLTIDDRAICFDGDWSDMEPADLLMFKPWNKRPPISAIPPYADTPLDVSFKVAIMPSGDLGRLRLTKDGAKMLFTKEQARSLANEIIRSLGGEQ